MFVISKLQPSEKDWTMNWV